MNLAASTTGAVEGVLEDNKSEPVNQAFSLFTAFEADPYTFRFPGYA